MIFSFESIQYWSITKYINMNHHWFWNYSNNEGLTTNNSSSLTTISLTTNLHPSLLLPSRSSATSSTTKGDGAWKSHALADSFREGTKQKICKNLIIIAFQRSKICFFCLLFPLFLAKKGKIRVIACNFSPTDFWHGDDLLLQGRFPNQNKQHE